MKSIAAGSSGSQSERNRALLLSVLNFATAPGVSRVTIKGADMTLLPQLASLPQVFKLRQDPTSERWGRVLPSGEVLFDLEDVLAKLPTPADASFNLHFNTVLNDNEPCVSVLRTNHNHVKYDETVLTFRPHAEAADPGGFFLHSNQWPQAVQRCAPLARALRCAFATFLLDHRLSGFVPICAVLLRVSNNGDFKFLSASANCERIGFFTNLARKFKELFGGEIPVSMNDMWLWRAFTNDKEVIVRRSELQTLAAQLRQADLAHAEGEHQQTVAAELTKLRAEFLNFSPPQNTTTL